MGTLLSAQIKESHDSAQVRPDVQHIHLQRCLLSTAVGYYYWYKIGSNICKHFHGVVGGETFTVVDGGETIFVEKIYRQYHFLLETL